MVGVELDQPRDQVISTKVLAHMRRPGVDGRDLAIDDPHAAGNDLVVQHDRRIAKHRLHHVFLST